MAASLVRNHRALLFLNRVFSIVESLLHLTPLFFNLCGGCWAWRKFFSSFKASSHLDWHFCWSQYIGTARRLKEWSVKCIQDGQNLTAWVQNWIESILISVLKSPFLPSVCFWVFFAIRRYRENIVLPALIYLVVKSETKKKLMLKLLEKSR